MTREEIRARIEEVGIIPAIRVSSTEDALLRELISACHRGGMLALARHYAAASRASWRRIPAIDYLMAPW